MNIWFKSDTFNKDIYKCWFICFRSDFCVGWLISNCHWSPAKRIVSFHVPKAVNSFCQTSGAKIVFSFEMFTGPKRNAHLSFTSHMARVTFPIRLQRKRYLACNCSLVCSETMTFLWKMEVTCFCYTSAAKLMQTQLPIHALVWIWMRQWNAV